MKALTTFDRTGPGRAARLALLLGLLLLCALSACTPRNAIQEARERGARDGYRDGHNDGDAEGYEATFEDAEDAAYAETLNGLYASGQYQRVRGYTAGVLCVSFLLGFGLQYVVLYLLRRNEMLFDIDRIILRREATAVDLAGLGDELDPTTFAASRGLAHATRRQLTPPAFGERHGE
jgi:hypothetical protein